MTTQVTFETASLTICTPPAPRLLCLPDVLERFPVSRSVWFAGVRSGKFPAPVKIGRLSFWRESSLSALISAL